MTKQDLERPVLVTGAAGYIGSVVVRQLLALGYTVRAVDTLTFGGASIMNLLDDPRFEFRKADVRDADAMTGAVEGVGAVVHLAAIVGDPACARQPELAESVNFDASIQLHRLAEAAGARRFVFASTCSNYGKSRDADAFVNERSELTPVSLYARTKVAVEEHLLSGDRGSCAPTCLRFSTVYGLSPRPRFDLTVNAFTRDLALGRELVVFGEQFWRPYCHVRDLARSVVLVLEADTTDVADDVFNVGDSDENYRKQTIVELIQEQIPDARVRYVAKDEDPRDYRVAFDKIRDRIGFAITRRVPDGIREIREVVQQGFFLNPDDPSFANVPPADHGR
jgi:nucleoside-diphosphate-sugar epimerase